MNRQKNAVVLTALVKKLRDQGSWCGETHVQKSAYTLQKLFEVPLDFDFILYKHGPFSFELRDEMTALRADGLLRLEPQVPPYGPRVSTTSLSDDLQKHFPKTFRKYERKIAFVAEIIDGKGVAELERLATALFVTRESNPSGSPSERADTLISLKPHVSRPDADIAIKQIDQISERVKKEFQ